MLSEDMHEVRHRQSVDPEMWDWFVAPYLLRAGRLRRREPLSDGSKNC